jgi:tRNA (guanine-N7-)-methyltransferase
MSESAPRRSVRSFVIRAGRMTEAQQRALDDLLPRYRVTTSALRDNFSEIFPRRVPLYLEIGTGNGDNVLAMAARLPAVDVLASEVHPPGVGHTVHEVERRGLENLRIYDGDALELLAALAPESLDAVFIFFPDPWPKKRHHKRRLIQPAFVRELARRLKPGGYLHLATDWQEYAVHMLEVLAAEPALVNTAADYAPRPEWRPLTNFEQKGLAKGHGVWDLMFTRR